VSIPSDSFVPGEHDSNISPQGETLSSQAEQVQSQEVPQATTAKTTMTLPPEAQGETNGGPLGCCLGVTIGLLLSLSIAVLSRLYAEPLAHIFNSWLSLIVRVAMILLAIVAVIICGYFGWRIGRKAYREYDPPVVKDRRRKPKATAKSRRA
jgi:hypothetical protein